MALEHALSYSVLASPLLLIVIAIIGVIAGLRWRRTGLTVAIVSLVAFYALATPGVAYLLIAGLEKKIENDTGKPVGAAAIVILSGDIQHSADPQAPVRPGLLSLERLDFGAREYRAMPYPVLVTGGPIAGTDVAVAELMAETLIRDFGVPVRWRETKARTTFENAEFSAAILKKAGISSAIIVTQRWHMARAIWAFERFGIHAIPTKFASEAHAPKPEFVDFLPEASALARSTYAIHEIFGLAYYRLTKSRHGRSE